MGIWPVSRSTQWVSVPFLTPRSFFRKPRWRTCARVVTEESYVSEKVAHTWHPYRPAVKAKTWKQHGMFSVCDTLARTGSVNSSYREPQVVCHLLSCCVHTSITSESESKVFKMIEEVRYRVHRLIHFVCLGGLVAATNCVPCIKMVFNSISKKSQHNCGIFSILIQQASRSGHHSPH